jgi:UDP-N-acetylmuramoyl-tripeptide--D-alanyl-D-alanine ligase
MSRRLILEAFLSSEGVSTDSRSIKKGQLFFALKGSNFNGNIYAHDVVQLGAELVVVDEDLAVNHPKIIRVDNALKALQELAADYRDMFDIPFLAITGSNGKTTCKELIRDVLAKKFRVSATKGNLNNHIGIPLTILAIPRDCEFAVIEMGANHLNEIASYCGYAKPGYGYITNIGLAHLEGFGGEEGVIRGKSELFDFISEKRGVIFGDMHQPKMRIAIAGRDFISTSMEDVGIILCSEEPCLSYRVGDGEIIDTKFSGVYNLMNIAAAIGIGRYFDVPEHLIHEAISSYIPDSNRSEILRTSSNVIIMDAYNANPSSMEHALKSFGRLKTKDKIAILGDMKELGKDSVLLHQSIINLVHELNVNAIFVGENFFQCDLLSTTRCFQSMNELAEELIIDPIRNNTILLKGSRGMRMESIVQYL